MCWALLPTHSSDMPTSLCGGAILLGRVDGPVSPSASEPTSPEQTPCCTVQLPSAGLGSKKLGSLQQPKAPKSHSRKAETNQENRNRDLARLCLCAPRKGPRVSCVLKA